MNIQLQNVVILKKKVGINKNVKCEELIKRPISFCFLFIFCHLTPMLVFAIAIVTWSKPFLQSLLMLPRLMSNVVNLGALKIQCF